MEFWALSYSLPANPSRYRVAAWKALKELGAVYLQPAVAVAPRREELREALMAVREQVLAAGGKAALLTMAYEDEADEAALVEAFRAARREEYAGIADDARRLEAQLDWEEGRHQGTVPTEELHRYILEAGRLQRRLATARAHDFFGAPGEDEAAAALEALTARLPESAGASQKRTRRTTKTAKKKSGRKSEKAGVSPTAKVGPEDARDGAARGTPAVSREERPTEQDAEEESREERSEMPVFLF